MNYDFEDMPSFRDILLALAIMFGWAVLFLAGPALIVLAFYIGLTQ